MIVVDTNVIAYLLIDGDHTARADAVMRRDPDWVAPLLWRSEFRNLLLLYLRQKSFDFDHALKVLRNAEDLMHQKEHAVSSLAIMTLAVASGCSAYDCEFVALAQDLDVPMVTSDQKILAAFPETAMSFEAFIAT